jgi:hypothetical protein
MSSEYKNSDLALASALVCRGHKLDAVDRSGGRRAFFIFPWSQTLEADVDAFWRDELKLSPRLYFLAVKEVKARLYNAPS